MGVVEEFTFDKLLDALRVCVQTCPLDAQGERLALSDNGDALQVRTHDENLSLHTPLFSAQAPRTTLLHRRLDHSRGSAHAQRHRQSGRNAVLHRLQRTRGSVRRFSISSSTKPTCGAGAWPAYRDGESRPECTLTDAVRLMRGPDAPQEPLSPPPRRCRISSAKRRRRWQAKFYRCVGTVRSLLQDHRASSGEEAPGLLPAPGRVHRTSMLRWCHPNRTECSRKKAVYARQGVFLTLLAGLTLKEGVAITAAEALTSRP